MIAGLLGSAAAGVVIAVVATRSDAPAKPDEPAKPIDTQVEAKPPEPKPEPPKPPDPQAEVAAKMTPVLDAFAAWSKAHASSPCPEVVALGVPADDPWHHALRITCVDQPGDQIIGVVSAGPDGVAGTPDDVASWQLGRDVTDRVRGARWASKPVADVTKHHAETDKTKTTTKTDKTDKTDKTKHHIEVDENGLPVTR